MTDLYLMMVEEDTKYIQDLRAEIVRWKDVYKSRVFDGTWGKSTRATITALKQDLKDTVESLKDNLEKAIEERRLVDEAHIRQSQKDQINAGGQGPVSEDSDNVTPRVEQESVGTAHQEDDHSGSQDEPREVSDGFADCF